MSVFQFLASNKPLKEIKNTNKEYLNEIEINNNMYYSSEYAKEYSNKKHFSELQVYTKLRAKQLIEYLKEQLKDLNEIEIWNIWLDDHELTSIRTVHISELSIYDLEFLDSSDKPICLIIKK